MKILTYETSTLIICYQGFSPFVFCEEKTQTSSELSRGEDLYDLHSALSEVVSLVYISQNLTKDRIYFQVAPLLPFNCKTKTFLWLLRII